MGPRRPGCRSGALDKLALAANNGALRGEIMSLRSVRFVVVMLAALSLSVAVGHVLQLPARLAWDQYLWVGATVQGGFFSLPGPLGVLLQVVAIVALIVLAMLIRNHDAGGFALTAGAAALFAVGLVAWWILVYPVNVELAKWVNGPVPDDWADWRALWEWGQAANGLAQLAGFAALALAVSGTERGRAA
jgi:hypothetical protein